MVQIRSCSQRNRRWPSYSDLLQSIRGLAAHDAGVYFNFPAHQFIARIQKNSLKIEYITVWRHLTVTTSMCIFAHPIWSAHRWRESSLKFCIFQLLLLDIALLVNANAAEITMLLGNDIIMILAGNFRWAKWNDLLDNILLTGAIGSTLLNPYKWFWWVVGMIFFALVFIQVFGAGEMLLNASRDGINRSFMEGFKRRQ